MLRLALKIWLLFVPIAIVNGGVRRAVYQELVGERVAQYISTALASAAFVGLASVLAREHFEQRRTPQLLSIGMFWVVLTVLFEFLFGHYVAKSPWHELINAYNLAQGKVWPFFLLTEFLTPIVLRTVRRAGARNS